MVAAEDFIRREVSKTGFPLELEIFSILTSGPWVVSAQSYYYDDDEKKSRYIDLDAMDMPDFDEKGNIVNPVEPLNLNWNLAIECKKSKQNWVFFPVDDYYVDTSGLELNITQSYGPGFGHYDPRKYKIASIYSVIPKGKDEIFEGVMQVVKYISHSKNKIWERIKYNDSFKFSMNFWFPIIVLDGKMWNIHTEKGQITDIVESKHTILKLQYGSSKIPNEGFAIDIVQKSYFLGLMEIILNDMKSFEKSVSRDKKGLMKELEQDFKKRIQPKNLSIPL